MKTLRHAIAIAMGVCALASTSSVRATPYASGITNMGGNGSGGSGGATFQYILNEPCTNVYVISYPSVTSNSLGVNGAGGASLGKHQFTLPGTDTSFAIYCTNLGTGTPHQFNVTNGTGVGQSSLVDANGPRGVAVNTNAYSPYFGTIYFGNASPGTDGVRSTGRGVYALNADCSDAFGYGSNNMPTGVTWGNSTTYSCYHVYVGPDDMVYATDGSTATLGGGVWMFPPNLASYTDLFQYNPTTFGSNILFNPISISVNGSYAAGNLTLYTMEWDRYPYQNIWQYPFFSSPGTPITLPWAATSLPNALTPSGACGNDPYGNPFSHYSGLYGSQVNCGIYTVNTVLADMAIAPDGKIFCAEDRGTSTGNDTSGNTALTVFNNAASGYCEEWNSMDQNGGSVDGLDAVLSVAVSGDDLFVAVGHTSTTATGGNSAFAGAISVMPLNYTNVANIGGLPSLAEVFNFKFNNSVNEALRGICFDAADNIYSLSGTSSDSMRAFTMGFTSVTVTSNDFTGTNGSFNVNYPTYKTQFPSFPTIAITSPQNLASTNYGTPIIGEIQITRNATSTALTVNYTLSGTATNNVDYAISPSASSVTFPIGVATETIYITNIEPTTVSLPTLTAVLNITPNLSLYQIGGVTNATVYLANEGPQAITITGAPAATMYRGLTNDFVTFTVTRWGDTNAGAYTLPPSAFTIGGTAAYITDYQAGPQPVNFNAAPIPGIGSAITINPGDVSDPFEVGMPVAHGTYTGNLTVTAAAVSGTSPEGTNFTGRAGTVTNTLLDNLNPPENIIWSDTLSLSADSVNWTGVFSQNIGYYPYIFEYPNFVNPGTNNFDANFGYQSCAPLSASPAGDGLVVPPSGYPTTLRMTAVKNSADNPNAGGVNFYPNPSFCPVLAGNYSIRFQMNLVVGCNNSFSTDFALFGINHYGTNANWWLGSPVASNAPNGAFSFTNSDGVWFTVTADPNQVGSPPGGYPGDYGMFTATNSSAVNNFFPSTGFWPLAGWSYLSWTNVFKDPVDYNELNPAEGNDYMVFPPGDPINGVPANQSAWGSDAYSTGFCPASGNLATNGPWTDVEIRQSNNVITLYMNKSLLFTFNNNTPFTKGYPMLGYMRPYNNVGIGGGVYYSDIRAVELNAFITNQPVGAAIGVGTNYTFVLGAVGLGPFTNTWYYTNAGTTTQVQQDTQAGPYNDSDSFAITSAGTPNGGQYYVVVQDSSGVGTTSSVVTLTVGTGAAITSGPVNVTNWVGGPATFSVTTNGSAPIAIQWKTNGVNLTTSSPSVSGAVTNATLNLTNIQLSLNGETYSVLVSNAYGNQSGSATLTVLAPVLGSITNVHTNGASVGFGFNTEDPYDTTNSFKLLASTNLSLTNAGFTNVTPLPANTFTTNGTTNFNVTYPTNGANVQQFFQVEHK